MSHHQKSGCVMMLASLQRLCFASRWWSSSSQSSAASLCLSFWWNKISLPFPSTGEWLRRRGETHTHTHIFLLIPTLINICSIEPRMLSMFMEHEASSVNSTHHCLQRVEGYSPVMSAAAVLIIFSLAPSRSTGCLAISNSRTSKGGSWWLLICLAEGWTSSGSTSSSTTTCQKILTPIYTGWVLKSGKRSVDVLFHEGIWGVEARL